MALPLFFRLPALTPATIAVNNADNCRQLVDTGPLTAFSDLAVSRQLGRAPIGTGEIAVRAVEGYSEEGG